MKLFRFGLWFFIGLLLIPLFYAGWIENYFLAFLVGTGVALVGLANLLSQMWQRSRVPRT